MEHHIIYKGDDSSDSVEKLNTKIQKLIGAGRRSGIEEIRLEKNSDFFRDSIEVPRVLILDDNPTALAVNFEILKDRFNCVLCPIRNKEEGLDAISFSKPWAYTQDLSIDENAHEYTNVLGYEIIKEQEKINPNIQCVIVSSQPEIIERFHNRHTNHQFVSKNDFANFRTNLFSAVEEACKLYLIRLGISSPEEVDATWTQIMINQGKSGPETVKETSTLLGNSKAIKDIHEIIENIAKAESEPTVLITGESGTGKELLASEIKNNSKRSDKEFIPINCGNIHSQLAESELFGHVKGAFTDAKKDRVGIFESAQDGTLFLDEIGDLNIGVQVKILRVLEDHKFTRLGESKPRSTNVRIIAATNKNLEEEIERGNFREDLYYRLKVCQINIPPLRERKEDIPVLINAFIKKFSSSKELEKTLKNFMIDKYHWPGNVRELKNTIESIIAMSPKNLIYIHDIPKELKKTFGLNQFIDDEHLTYFKNISRMLTNYLDSVKNDNNISIISEIVSNVSHEKSYKIYCDLVLNTEQPLNIIKQLFDIVDERGKNPFEIWIEILKQQKPYSLKKVKIKRKKGENRKSTDPEIANFETANKYFFNTAVFLLAVLTLNPQNDSYIEVLYPFFNGKTKNKVYDQKTFDDRLFLRSSKNHVAFIPELLEFISNHNS